MIESRRWKHAYTEDVESPFDVPRVELTASQKAYLVRAWTYSFGYVPNAIPIHNEEEPFGHRPGIKIQWHHVVPIGESTRLYGEGARFYNDPRNLVPVCAVNHIGSGATPEDFVIHEDTQAATASYGLYKQGEIDNPYSSMVQERRQVTAAGMKYHRDEYDRYMLEVADAVISRYSLECPEDRWPVTDGA